MRDLSSLAEQIRAVRQAQRRFLGRWRMEQVIVGPEVLDRLADDMAAAHRELESEDRSPDRASQTSIAGDWRCTHGRIWSM